MNPRKLTREAIEELNDIEPYCFETDREEQWFNVGLQYGLDVADSNPISPWISVNDDLPCNHEELLNDDNRTMKVIVRLNHGKYKICIMCNKDGDVDTKWHWVSADYVSITHWMPIPKLPK